MTALLAGARKLTGPRSDLGSRLAGLEEAVAAARGRLDDDLLDDAAGVVERASGRLRLSGEHTVVALAGATGSGKSTTFNALAGLDVVEVGVRRPTTSHATACVWASADGADLGADATGVLDWLGIPARHRVDRRSALDAGGEAPGSLDGLVLLDLPDHDSTEVAHHVEVDRLVALADLLVWVLDPQKYADAAIHERYLRPLARHSEVMLVVLNQLDTVPEARRAALLADVRRRLAEDGLGDVPVLGLSAREGTGVSDLRALVAERVAGKKAARQRLAADVRRAASRLEEVSGTAAPRELSRGRVAELEDAFADAAGVPTVVAAVRSSTRLRGARATGWPVVSWVTRLRPDPLRRLHLDLGSAGRELTGVSRTSVPHATPVERSRVERAVRAAADDVAEPLARPWQQAVRRASVARLPDLTDRLDRSLASTELGVERLPRWTGAVRLLQWLLVLAALAGGGWLVALAGLAYLQLPEPETPRLGGVPVPTLLLAGGVLAGVLLGVVCRLLVGWTARRRARAADRRLRRAVRTVTDELVREPIDAELAAYRRVREGLRTALA